MWPCDAIWRQRPRSTLAQVMACCLMALNIGCAFHQGPLKLTLTHWPLGKFEWKFRYAIFKRIWVIDGWGISCEIAHIWMSLDFTEDQSTLVQVMALCHQATSHYLSPCWPRSPYGVIGHDELIPVWISNYVHYKVRTEITYPFPNFNGATTEVWEWISNFTLYWACDYLYMLWLKSNHVSKRVPRKDLNYLCHISFKIWENCNYFLFLRIN